MKPAGGVRRERAGVIRHNIPGHIGRGSRNPSRLARFSTPIRWACNTLVGQAWLGAQRPRLAHSKTITPLGSPSAPSYAEPLSRTGGLPPPRRAAHAAPGTAIMTDAQVQLHPALNARTSDLEITPGAALDCDLDGRMEATRRVLRWLDQALEQPEAEARTLHKDVNLLLGKRTRAHALDAQGEIAGPSKGKAGRESELDPIRGTKGR